jgi:hypothetical protein
MTQWILTIGLSVAPAMLLAACGGTSNAQPSDAVIKQSVLKGLRATVQAIAGPHLSSRIPDVMKALDAIAIAGKQCQQAQGQPGYVCAYRIAMAGREIAVDERRFTKIGDAWSVSDDPKPPVAASLTELAEKTYRQTVGTVTCKIYDGSMAVNDCIGDIFKAQHKSGRWKADAAFAWRAYYAHPRRGEAEGPIKVLSDATALDRPAGFWSAPVEVYFTKGADSFYANPHTRKLRLKAE